MFREPLLIVDGPTIAARYRAWEKSGVGGQDPHESLDAANECIHERLPGDRTPPCGCFPGLEPDPPREVVTLPKKPATRKRNRVKVTAGPQAQPEFIAQMVASFDSEIERLQKARELFIAEVSK